jgi:hypothetical protein
VSNAASQATAFYREVAVGRAVWTIRDDGGFPAPMNSDGQIATVPAYAAFRVVEVSWEDLRSRWMRGLAQDNIHVGVNWSGPEATGYDIAPEDVVRNVDALADPP